MLRAVPEKQAIPVSQGIRIAGCYSRARGESIRRLSKEVFHGTHRQEEPSLDSGQLEKSIPCIKRECSSTLCVDDDTCGSHFPAVLKGSIERIHQWRGSQAS